MTATWFSSRPFPSSSSSRNDVGKVERQLPRPVGPTNVAEAMAAHQNAMVSHIRTTRATTWLAPRMPEVHHRYRELKHELWRERSRPTRTRFLHPVPDVAGADDPPATVWSILQDSENRFDALVKEGPSLALQDYVDRLGGIVDSLSKAADVAIANHWDVLAHEIDTLKATAIALYKELVGPAERTRDELVVLGLVVLLGGVYLFGTAGGQALLYGYGKGAPHVAVGLGRGVADLGAGVGKLAAGGGLALAKVG